jgi:hypothetical protein
MASQRQEDSGSLRGPELPPRPSKAPEENKFRVRRALEGSLPKLELLPFGNKLNPKATLEVAKTTTRQRKR